MSRRSSVCSPPHVTRLPKDSLLLRRTRLTWARWSKLSSRSRWQGWRSSWRRAKRLSPSCSKPSPPAARVAREKIWVPSLMKSDAKRPEGKRLREIVAAFPKTKVAVMGDLVADEFVYGEISRVSREAPVLILKHRERTIVPGGGANAVNNLADLDVNVLPVGIVCDDEAGRPLVKEVRDKRRTVRGDVEDHGADPVD